MRFMELNFWRYFEQKLLEMRLQTDVGGLKFDVKF
jgi:hypothetical protein